MAAGWLLGVLPPMTVGLWSTGGSGGVLPEALFPALPEPLALPLDMVRRTLEIAFPTAARFP